MWYSEQGVWLQVLRIHKVAQKEVNECGCEETVEELSLDVVRGKIVEGESARAMKWIVRRDDADGRESENDEIVTDVVARGEDRGSRRRVGTVRVIR